MRLYNLELKNIGPFLEANIEFIGDKDDSITPPVIVITGENGTGKSIILDSIRALIMGSNSNLERDITSSENFELKSMLSYNDEKKIKVIANSKTLFGSIMTNNSELTDLFSSAFTQTNKTKFLINYWTSKLSDDDFEIKNIENPKPKNYLVDSLKGIHLNVDVTKSIVYFDYLSDSKNPEEQKIGKKLFSLLNKIIDISVEKGELQYVSRIDLQPIIKVYNKEISLSKLSSGNLYLIQRFVKLLNQAYTICVAHNIPIDKIEEIPGLLLIDEAENHLHPKWQKVFIKNILNIFPKLQIIVTTHSPFIVSSIEDSRLYVCSSEGDKAVIREETSSYANLPVEEILRSPLFSTNSFNKEISALLEERKKAIGDNDDNTKKIIEQELLAKNPEYFNYLIIKDLIGKIKK